MHHNQQPIIFHAHKTITGLKFMQRILLRNFLCVKVRDSAQKYTVSEVKE